MAASSTPNGTIIQGFGLSIGSTPQRYAAAQKGVKQKAPCPGEKQSIHKLSARGSAAFSVSEPTILELSESCWTSGIEAP
jgi:hypothetical protein